MAEPAPELSPKMRTLAEAIRTHEGKVRLALFGFDLWLEVMASGHVSMLNFCAGGKVADGTEPENTLIVPVQVIGGSIVVGFDPTLPADGFALKAEPAAS